MKILLNNEINRKEWRELVQISATGTWFQTPETYNFFASQPELFRPFVIGLENDDVLKGVCSGYVTVEKNPLTQFLTRRAIIIGGPCLADDATDEEVETLMRAVRTSMADNSSLLLGKVRVGFHSPIYIETRNFNDYSRWKDAFEKAGFSYQPHLNFHVDCTDKETMWRRLSENRKKQIRKVTATWSHHDAAMQPNEPQASLLNDENDVREWYAILQQLYLTKVKTPLWPVEFFIEAYRQGVGKFLLVKHDGKVIGGSMIVQDEKSVYEWFECGLNSEYKEQYPSVMATWKGMCYANEHGCARYDMMGAGEPNVPYGVRDFKAEFGGQQVEFGRFLWIRMPLLYKIGTIGVRILKR